MKRIIVSIKDPDAINALIIGKLGKKVSDDDYSALSSEYFEFGDYMCIAINPKTWECEIVPT